MADAVVSFFANMPVKALNKEIDFNTDALKCQLHTSTYAPNLLTHDYQDDLTNEVAAGGEYVTGGVAMTTCAVTLVTAASAPAWATATAYKLGQLVRKVASNGHIYRCIVAGTSDASEPTWPTNPGEDVVDNTAKWEEAGSAYLKLDADDPLWAASTITARYGVIVDTTPGSAATNPLVVLIDFLADKSSSGGEFKITFDATYGIGLLRIV